MNASRKNSQVFMKTAMRGPLIGAKLSKLAAQPPPTSHHAKKLVMLNAK